MKILCSLALVGLTGLIAQPPAVPLKQPVEHRAGDLDEGISIAKTRKGVTQARCMIRSGDKAVASVHFEWMGEKRNAKVSTPVSVRLFGINRTLDLTIAPDLATIFPDARTFGFVLRAPRFEGGGSLTWYHKAAAPADSDAVYLALPDGVQILVTGDPEASVNTLDRARADCLVIKDPPVDN